MGINTISVISTATAGMAEAQQVFSPLNGSIYTLFEHFCHTHNTFLLTKEDVNHAFAIGMNELNQEYINKSM